MRRVYLRLIQAWLPGGAAAGLKTDLFEEAVSQEGLLADLGSGSVGMDGSYAIARAARGRLAGSSHRFVVGDLRAVPFRSEAFGQLFSGSSLDHFTDKAELARSLQELSRVLAEGASAIVTLDNPHNPIVALRNRLPFAPLHRLGIVPYYVGATLNRNEGVSSFTAAGFLVTRTTAVAHAPRILAIRAITLCERRGATRAAARIGQILDLCELLERLPTRWWTGYYLAYKLEKRSRQV
jgi:SAM-dependent methyltransferase